MLEIKVNCRTYYGIWQGKMKPCDIPVLGDVIEFGNGELFYVVARTFLKEVGTGEVHCDLYLQDEFPFPKVVSDARIC